MATHQIRRFSRPQFLKSVSTVRLSELLTPYRDYFTSVGLKLPADPTKESIDYDALARILTEAGGPADLVRAIHYIDEMSDDQGMDALVEAGRRRRQEFLKDDATATPADLALAVWLLDPELLERTHAEQQVFRPRTFQSFQAKGPTPKFEMPSAGQLHLLESELDNWFAARHRGRGTRVFVSVQEDGVWFLVRHGELYRREGRMDDAESPHVFYRPEKFDVVVYRPALGEIRINARLPQEKEFYRQQFGKHLFGDASIFGGRSRYTLAPLREGAAALATADVPGLEWAKLTEVWFYWGGEYNEVEIHKADDLMARWSRAGTEIPPNVQIQRATFQLKFEDSRRPRTVALRPTNVAQYSRDSDSHRVEMWLLNRGFFRACG